MCAHTILWCVCVFAWCVQCHMDALTLHLLCHFCKVVRTGTKSLFTLELLYVWPTLTETYLMTSARPWSGAQTCLHFWRTKPMPHILSTGQQAFPRSLEVIVHQIYGDGTLCFYFLFRLFVEMEQQQDKNACDRMSTLSNRKPFFSLTWPVDKHWTCPCQNQCIDRE